MKKLIYLLIPIFLLVACKDDDDHLCPECEICEECEAIPGYTNHTVDFYTTHENFIVQPPVFETVTEQVLVKSAHQEGAFFETVTETYLYKESYTRHQILDSMQIHLVVNSETDSVGSIDCFHFYDESDFVAIEVPAEYKTRTMQILAQQGTGAAVPAEYGTITHRLVVSDSEIVPIQSAQLFNRITFRIPEDKTMVSYLLEQFEQQSVVDCLEGNSFVILN